MTDVGKKPRKPTRPGKLGQLATVTSGNRRKQLPQEQMGIDECALDLLQQHVWTTLNGKLGWYSFAELVAASIVHDAVKGCNQARRLLIDFQTKFARSIEVDIFGFPLP